MKMDLVLGIDIGGTNTAFGLVDKKGNIVFQASISTIEAGDPETLLNGVYQQVSKAGYSPKSIGIGAPNGNSKTGKIEYAPNLSWNGIVEIESIAEKIWGVPSFLVNDANAAALGELAFGCARGLDHFICITLGTGLGSGIIINKQLVIGANGLAGEFGHISVDSTGRKCGCGRLGCLETYASATGVINSLNEMRMHNPKSAEGLEQITTARELFDAAKSGHAGAAKIVGYTAEKLGYALANFAAFSDPEAYVLFGGIAQSGNYFLDQVQAEVKKHSLKIYENVQILLSSLPASNAAILGAAAAAKQITT